MTATSTSAGALAIAGTGLPASNGYVAEWMELRSRLLTFLPGFFSEGEQSSFLGRYLLIFETIFDSVDLTISQLPDYFAAATAPDEFLPWLASWVGLVLDDGWPLDRRRAVLARATELHRWRGTVRGLTEHVELYTGIRPEIIEGGAGFKLDRNTQLGQQLMLGGADRQNHFSVLLRAPDPDALDQPRIRAVIEAHRPAHATAALFIVPAEESSPTDGNGARAKETGR